MSPPTNNWRYSCLIYVICVCLSSSLPPVVSRRAHDLFTLFVFVSVRLYLQLLVGGLMSYLHYLCLFGSSLPPVVSRRTHVLFTLFVFVWFVFTSSC